MQIRPGCDLVDLVNKDDALLLHAFKRFTSNIVLIDEFCRFLIGKDFHRLGNPQASGLLPTWHLRKQLLQLLGELFHTGGAHHFEGRRWLVDFEFDLPVVELAFTQLFAKLLSGGRLGSINTFLAVLATEPAT